MCRPCLELHTATLPSIFAASLLLCGIIGCGSSNSPTADTPPPPSAGLSFNGKAMAGSLPLIGASVQLYAAGTTGNGSNGSALLSPALTTDASGAFTIPASYTCPSTKSQLYVIARGGKPGATATSTNSAITLITAVGACNQITTSTQIITNEVTTAAAAYALSQFLASGGNLGASSTNTVGLQNAVATALALADITKGTSPSPSFSANGTSPAAIIDSVANLLNTCTIAPAGNACSTLFSATTLSSASGPTNTLDAALKLVRNPAANVVSLYALSTGSSAFGPALAAAPPDWILYVNYTGGGMHLPSALGVDSAGNVWVASYFNTVSIFSPLGKPLLPQGITGSGLNESYGLAIDANDHAWIPNQPNSGVGGSVSVFDSTGQSFAGSNGFTGGGIYYPYSVAIDTDGSAWVVDYGNSHLTHLSSSGLALSGASGYTSAQLSFPVAAAVDASRNVWLANQDGTTVTKVSPDGSQFNSYQSGGAPSSLAIDQLGNVWVANYQGNSISEFSSSGAVLAPVPYTGGGINHPQGVAIDGAGDVWLGNFLGNSITKLAGAAAATPGAALSPAAGLGSGAALSEAFALAIDASGNLWISNAGNNTLTEFVGLASPVKTPLLALPKAP